MNTAGLLTCLQKLPAASAFKPSVCKGETERQFLPLNLQIHRTIIYPPITPEKTECSTCGNRVCLDIVTVGGFVAHALKYKRISSSLLQFQLLVNLLFEFYSISAVATLYAEGAKRLLGQCRLCSTPLNAVFHDAVSHVSSTSFTGTAGERAGPEAVYMPPAPDVPLTAGSAASSACSTRSLATRSRSSLARAPLTRAQPSSRRAAPRCSTRCSTRPHHLLEF